MTVFLASERSGDVSPGQSDARRTAGEAQRRSPANLEEEALRPDRRGAPVAQLPGSVGRRSRTLRGVELGLKSQRAALRTHGDGGLRGVQARTGVLHRGHEHRRGDRLPLSAGRYGVERGDRLGSGPLQESPSRADWEEETHFHRSSERHRGR